MSPQKSQRLRASATAGRGLAASLFLVFDGGEVELGHRFLSIVTGDEASFDGFVEEVRCMRWHLKGHCFRAVQVEGDDGVDSTVGRDPRDGVHLHLPNGIEARGLTKM